ncbi:CPA_1a_G0028120.mRNA.1.CDS.1 [Saccharomyces cerevisiae]|nr:CPA_1a_G0028120.mRNA.1.CDS.1 [Saccharomyces cerevisiae]CAI7347194.1 CPA_1a_G0028120.mRNA.1.CDS.1 [Saccharomyces cerevisiae]
MLNKHSINKNQSRSKHQTKNFSGCWTCRSRKVKCDLGHPSCNECKRLGLQCAGYDIKLYWLDLVRYTKDGVLKTSNSKKPEKDSDQRSLASSMKTGEQQYQRRRINFVRYKDLRSKLERTDEILAMLQYPPPEMLKGNNTWMVDRFGVFRGTQKVEDSVQSEEETKELSPSCPEGVASHSERFECIDEPESLSTTLRPFNQSNTNTDMLVDQSEIVDKLLTQSSAQDTYNGVFGDYASVLDTSGLDWISSELRDDVLLSALALQDPFTGGSSNYLQGNTQVTALPTSADKPFPQSEPSSTQFTTNNKNNDLGSTNRFNNTQSRSNRHSKINNQSLKSAVCSLFDRRPSSLYVNHHTFSSPRSPENDNNSVSTGASQQRKEQNKPKTFLEILSENSQSKAHLEHLGQSNMGFELPRNGSSFADGLAKFLLNYFITNVADLMIVVTVSKNPWKNIFFPRVLNTLGDLTILGHSSNSRNSLLNAIAAVSCFHLINKFPENSQAQTLFLNLGIEFRRNASSFLKFCLGTTVHKEKYKDILAAIIAMSSIDVVWGTMVDCQYYLDVCENFMESRMKTRPSLSEKAKTLHRIFSFLKLIQDSTSLDRVKDDEIHFNDSASGSHCYCVVNDYEPNTSEKDGIGRGQFKESFCEKDGKVRIEFLKNPDAEGMDSSSTPGSVPERLLPMFTSITTGSYYYEEGRPLEADRLGTDSLYGLPNSLICMFSDCVKIVRHTEYYKMKRMSTPRKFTDILLKFEKRVLKWQSEWNFHAEANPSLFINSTVEGVYHHTMSFYYGLIIYYFTMARDLDNDFLQPYVEKVLEHLKLLDSLSENHEVKVLPLIWQGFIAGCSSTSPRTQQGFRTWAARFAGYGMGSYWGPRQVMYEVWRRRESKQQGDNWYSVYKDWGMNLMLL